MASWQDMLRTIYGAVSGSELQVDVVSQPNAVATARAAAAANMNAPAANTAAVVTKAAAGAGVANVVAGVYWSYDAEPTGGSLTITSGGVTVFQLSITAAGPGFLPFTPPLKGGANEAVVATLAAGGESVTGKVNLHTWTE
jgi:hypothetical protein